MPIRDTFSNSLSLAVINKYQNGAVVQISTVFGSVCHVVLRWSPGAGVFTHLYKHAFRVRNFGNAKSSFFWKCSKFKLQFKNGEKNRVELFVSHIIAS